MGVRPLLAAFVILAATVVTGCGGSDAEVQPAPDRSAEISALEKKVKDLEQGIADEEAARRQAAETETEAAEGRQRSARSTLCSPSSPVRPGLCSALRAAEARPLPVAS